MNKISSVNFLALFLVFLIALSSNIIFAYDYNEVVRQAETDASNDANQMLWAVPGFCCGVIGFAAAAVYQPKTQAERLVGKSPEYVRDYSIAYKAKAKANQMTGACIGWAVGTTVSLMFLLML